MEILVPLAALVLVVIFVAYVRRGQQPKVSCPQCGSGQVRLVEQHLEKLKQDESAGYAVKLDVQLILETTYRCQTCQHSWTVVAPER